MTIVIGDPPVDEIEAMIGLLGPIREALNEGRMTFGEPERMPWSTIEGECGIGRYRVHTTSGYSVVFIEPDTHARRKLEHLRIGDPEQAPALQMRIDDDRAGPRASEHCSMRAVSERISRTIRHLPRSISPAHEARAQATRLLTDTAEAMAAWASSLGQDSDSFVHLFAATPTAPTLCEWGADFAGDDEDPTAAIDEWGARRIPVMLEVEAERENQTLSIRLKPAMRTFRCGMDPMRTMRLILANPDMPR
jgi:hypothetical protein